MLTTDVLLISSDLFLGSRVRSAVAAGGWTIDVAGTAARGIERVQSEDSFRLILVDLETPGLRIDSIVAARSPDGPPMIAYGPHVHKARLDAARAAGCDQVLTRGQFDATLPQLLDASLDSDC